MTHRIEPFLLIRLTEWNPSFQFDSKNWTFFFKRTFSIWLKRWKFSICFEELNPFLIWPKGLTFFGKMRQIFDPFLNMTQRIDFFHKIPVVEPYFQNWLHRIQFLKVILSIEFFFFEKTLKELKNRTLLGYHSNDWFFFLLKIWLKELNFLFCSIWLKELFLFFRFKYLDLFHMTQRIEPSFLRDSNTWTFLKKNWIKEMDFFSGLKVFSSKKKLTELNFFVNWTVYFLSMTQRIEPLNFLYDAKIWTLFQHITQRIDFFEKESKNWTFWWIWLKELNSFWKCDSKNWTLFGSMPQRIELFLEVCTKKFNFFSNTTQRIEFFQIWLKDLNLSFWHDSKFWTFFFWCTRLKELNLLMNMTRFFRKKLTQRIETLSMTLETTQSTDFWFFQKYDSQNCNFFFSKLWLKELNFWSVTQRIEPFETITHRTELFFVTQRIELFFFCVLLKELNLFLNITQRIEPFFI